VKKSLIGNNWGKGICLILLSSVFSSTGQLFWKMSFTDSLFFLFLGFALYGIGAVLMTLSFRFGDISVLHPMLGFSIVLSLVFGRFVLKETLSMGKIAGGSVIITAIILLGVSNYRETKRGGVSR
jgi:undecaprenyl phosphate-alpha-L-ara4N flippase subunit ArnE